MLKFEGFLITCNTKIVSFFVTGNKFTLIYIISTGVVSDAFWIKMYKADDEVPVYIEYRI